MPTLTEIQTAIANNDTTTLRGLLAICDQDYYGGTPCISDEDYDAFREILNKILPEAAAKVGSPSNSVWPKVTLEIPMGSLLKVTALEDVHSWVEKYTLKREIFASHKIDGSSIELTYDGGIFIRGVTRGNGVIGEDVTPNVQKMGFPKKISLMGKVKIRGEAVIPLSNWDNFRKAAVDGQEDRNPRNSAAGSMRRLSGARCEYLAIFPFWIQSDSTPFFSKAHMFQVMVELGFRMPFHKLVHPKEIEDLLAQVETSRNNLDYEIDGVVLEENDVTFQQEMGDTDNRPRAARAFKFKSQSEETKLLAVTWQVGRTGALTPVGELEPVDIGGVTISRVMLNNPIQIQDQGLEIGCTVEIERRNDIIPYAKRRVDSVPGTPIDMPQNCPSCKKPTHFDGVRLLCLNQLACPDQMQYTIYHYLQTLDVKGFGDKLIEKLFIERKLRTPADLYQLQISDIAQLEGGSAKVADKVLRDLTLKSRSLTLPRFIKALGIKGFSESFTELVLDQFPTIAALQTATYQDLIAVPRIGPAVAQACVEGLKERAALIQSLLPHISFASAAPVATDGPLVGLSFCFTGFRSQEAEERIAGLGGKIASGVSSKTTYLVALDITGNSGKLKKARAGGTKLLTPADLQILLAKFP